MTPETKEGDTYYSKVLGFGEIEHVFPTRRIEQGRATLLEVKVVFECGQSCYFHRKSVPGKERQGSDLFREEERREWRGT